MEKQQALRDAKQAQTQLSLNNIEMQGIKNRCDAEYKEHLAALMRENRQALAEKEDSFQATLEQLREQYEIRISDLSSKMQDYIGSVRIKEAEISNLETQLRALTEAHAAEGQELTASLFQQMCTLHHSYIVEINGLTKQLRAAIDENGKQAQLLKDKHQAVKQQLNHVKLELQEAVRKSTADQKQHAAERKTWTENLEQLRSKLITLAKTESQNLKLQSDNLSLETQLAALKKAEK